MSDNASPEEAIQEASPMEGTGSDVNPLKRNRLNDDHEYAGDGKGTHHSDDTSNGPPKKIPELSEVKKGNVSSSTSKVSNEPI